jgi:hypothetical protein
VLCTIAEAIRNWLSTTNTAIPCHHCRDRGPHNFAGGRVTILRSREVIADCRDDVEAALSVAVQHAA